MKLDVGPMTKPVQEVAKSAVFSKLIDIVEGSTCLDLFAGSGNMGIEALSRGAKHVTFVEIDGVASKIIKQNLQNAAEKYQMPDLEKQYEIIRKDALDVVGDPFVHYDIIFLDPPYEHHITHLIKNVSEIMDPPSYLVYFHDKNKPLDISSINPELKIVDSRKYGLTMIDFIQLI